VKYCKSLRISSRANCGIDEVDGSHSLCAGVARRLEEEVPPQVCVVNANLRGPASLSEVFPSDSLPLSEGWTTHKLMRRITENLWFASRDSAAKNGGLPTLEQVGALAKDLRCTFRRRASLLFARSRALSCVCSPTSSTCAWRSRGRESSQARPLHAFHRGAGRLAALPQAHLGCLAFAAGDAAAVAPVFAGHTDRQVHLTRAGLLRSGARRPQQAKVSPVQVPDHGGGCGRAATRDRAPERGERGGVQDQK